MNTKRFLLAVVVVFIVHQALGYLIHQVLLMGLYEQTENLWRPAAKLKLDLPPPSEQERNPLILRPFERT